MDLLEYIRQRDATGKSDLDDREVEYRLLCSGMLHREVVGDWRHSDAGRMLLTGAFELS
jgi:hypothetical protein